MRLDRLLVLHRVFDVPLEEGVVVLRSFVVSEDEGRDERAYGEFSVLGFVQAEDLVDFGDAEGEAGDVVEDELGRWSLSLAGCFLGRRGRAD